MTESEFLERWRQDEPIYAAWGRYLANALRQEIEERVSPVTLELFLKLPVIPRIKDKNSLLQKAFHRRKGYQNPYIEIEDKVGLRFVTLVEDDVRLICDTIESCKNWTASKARDYEIERQERPYEFDYQSVHYIIKPAHGFNFEGQNISEQTTCEIQIRTLLQHSYSELTHDTIYKPNTATTPELKRLAARSMALIEATDSFFTQLSRSINQLTKKNKIIENAINDIYKNIYNIKPLNSPLNNIIIDHYKDFINNNIEFELQEFIRQKPFIGSRISERLQFTSLFHSPAIILVYYAVSRAPYRACIDSPLTDHELEGIYSDLGECLPS